MGDYIVLIENTEDCFRLQQWKRFMAYYGFFRERISSANNDRRSPNQADRMSTFWDRESRVEKKFYSKLKRWEDRHPIMSIVICTILGGILLSLIAGIILEAFLSVV